MPLRLKIEPGGEYLLPFAKKKLREMKAQMQLLGLTFQIKWFPVSASEGFFLQSQLVFGVWMDQIRISAGGGRWDFYYEFGFPATLYLGDIGGSIVEHATGVSSLVTTRSIDSRFAIYKKDSQWNVVDVDMNVSRVRPNAEGVGPYDTYPLLTVVEPVSLRAFTSSEAGWAAGFRLPTVLIDGGEGGSTAGAVIIAGDKTLEFDDVLTFGELSLIATRDEFFFAGVAGFGGSGTVRLYDMDGNTLWNFAEVLDDGPGLRLKPRATLQDVLTSGCRFVVGSGIVYIDTWSAKFGLIHSYASVCPGGSPPIENSYYSGATGTDYYFFMYEYMQDGLPFEPGLPDQAYQHHSMIHCAGVFDAEGVLTGYNCSGVRSTIKTIALQTTTHGLAVGKNHAHAYFNLFNDDGFERYLYQMDGDGNVVVVDDDIDNVVTGPLNAVAAGDKSILIATPDWFISPRAKRFYYSDGTSLDTAAVFSTFFPATLLANTNSTAYVFQGGVGSPSEKYLVGTDGSVLNLDSVLPAFATGGGNIASPANYFTTSNKIYALRGGTKTNPTPPPATVPLVSHTTQDAESYDYAASVEPGSAVLTPTRPYILTALEYEAWAVI